MRRVSSLFFGLAAFCLLRATAVEAGCLPAGIPDNTYQGILDGNDGFGEDAGMVCCMYDFINLGPGSAA